ncbi:hypothetical protein L596_007410 [Steinernema carpocapsae]|uniref:Uncharacterized protein n=1 Tax=Steinernema carpocapsae TaxID=34508 RepID=A0A4U5P9L9_STECR|nr:hypothetical protein L596_007410 [Steinernema carpocapsae]
MVLFYAHPGLKANQKCCLLFVCPERHIYEVLLEPKTSDLTSPTQIQTRPKTGVFFQDGSPTNHLSRPWSDQSRGINNPNVADKYQRRRGLSAVDKAVNYLATSQAFQSSCFPTGRHFGAQVSRVLTASLPASSIRSQIIKNVD